MQELTPSKDFLEIPGQRSGDYRFTLPDGSQISADLYQPESRRIYSIASNIIDKSSQTEIVVLELGKGSSDLITIEDVQEMAQSVINTPDHSINRLIIIKDSEIIVDLSR